MYRIFINRFIKFINIFHLLLFRKVTFTKNAARLFFLSVPPGPHIESGPFLTNVYLHFWKIISCINFIQNYGFLTIYLLKSLFFKEGKSYILEDSFNFSISSNFFLNLCASLSVALLLFEKTRPHFSMFRLQISRKEVF